MNPGHQTPVEQMGFSRRLNHEVNQSEILLDDINGDMALSYDNKGTQNI